MIVRLQERRICMRGQRGIYKRLIVVSVCILSVFLVVGCSTIDKVKSFFLSTPTSEAQAEQTRSKAQQFFSNVRPARGNPDSHYLLGRYYFERERYGEALVEFKKAASIKLDFVLAYNGMGACYDNMGEFARARDAYLAALEIDPNAAYVHNNLGYSHYMQKEYTAAVGEFKKAIELDQGNGRFRANLAIAYVGAEQYAFAAREFELGGHAELARQYSVRAEQSGNAAERDVVERILLPSTAGLFPSKDVAIEISNGNGINSMARQMGEYLKQKGFNVVRYTNADTFDHNATKVYYQKDALETTRALKGEIPEIQELNEVAKLDRPRLKVRMVMGRDLIAYKERLAGGR
jgi:Flp pilus assembly protein TadD